MRLSTFSFRHDECVSDLAHVSAKGAVPLLLVHLHNYDARAALALVQSHAGKAEQCDARLVPLFARVMAASLVGAPIQLIAPYSESRLSCANLSDVLGDYSARLSAADLNSYTDKDAADCWWLALVAVRPHRSLGTQLHSTEQSSRRQSAEWTAGTCARASLGSSRLSCRSHTSRCVLHTRCGRRPSLCAVRSSRPPLRRRSCSSAHSRNRIQQHPHLAYTTALPDGLVKTSLCS